MAVRPLTMGWVMGHRVVVETGWVSCLVADIEGYLVRWWPAEDGLTVAVDWEATKERLLGFGECLALVGAIQVAGDVLVLAAVAGERGRMANLQGLLGSEFSELSWFQLCGEVA